MPAANSDPQDREAQRHRYVRELLRLYVATPTVAGHIRRADRDLAAAFFDRALPLYAVENAFILAAYRRIRHNAYATPLPPIRSLHFFTGIIREVLDRPPGYREIEEMRYFLAHGD
jgi:hypothetical protein